ncbi:MAG TPA: porin family protein [Methylococcaceae bacterium]|nr:porin family protein [Methylococcaceae bacterium]
MIKKTNTLLASAVAAGVLMMAAQGAAAADKAAASSSPAAAIEQRMKMMEEQMQMMKAELARVRAESAKPAESSAKLEDRLSKLETSGGGKKKANNMVFFRGGYTRLDTDRGGDVLTNINNLAVPALGYGGEASNGGQEGWYFGAGFDFSLTDNMWGLLNGTPLSNTEALAELMFEYKKFDHQTYVQTPLQLVANSAVGGGLATGLTNPLGFDGGSVTISELTISAAPKLKFLEGQKFRPWVIPLGFAMHINTPTSDGVTYFNPGMVFGAGADYNIWGPIFVGADARYHLTANDNDNVATDGLTAGGYLGIGF